MSDTVQLIIGAALTIAVLSYLIGDNLFYRLAMHILVGVGAAYALAVAIGQVLIPQVFAPLSGLPKLLGSVELSDAERSGLLVSTFGLLGLVFLLAKLLRRAAWLGNVAVGYMLGVGAGVAIGGAIFGALVPQTVAAVTAIEPLSALGNFLLGALLLVSTVTTLLAFAYSRASHRGALGAVGSLGRGFLYIAFGATFALVFVASASVLSGWARGIFVWLVPGS